jgi:serine/threonine protein kinase
VCAALSYVHGEGLLHLDVKPSNIMYDDGHATLFDFSVAEEYSEDTPLRDNAGTVEYMAPEQTFRREVGYATDVFGLGVVLYQLLTGGELPYPVVKRPIPGRGDEPRRLLDYDVRPRPPLATPR